MGPTIHPEVEGDIYRRDVTVTSAPGQIAVPLSGHRIEIDGREGVFIVLRTDAERETVDVLRITGMRQIEAGIPMASARLLARQNSVDPFEKIDD